MNPEESKGKGNLFEVGIFTTWNYSAVPYKMLWSFLRVFVLRKVDLSILLEEKISHVCAQEINKPL